MKTYQVEIKETLCMAVEIVAENAQQALNNASIIRLSGIIPETLNRTGGSICSKEASK